MRNSKVETRVRYVFNPVLEGSEPNIYTYGDDDWYGPGPDGAASYPWLMNNCIVWVETRLVIKTDWEVEGEVEFDMNKIAIGEFGTPVYSYEDLQRPRYIKEEVTDGSE